MSLPSDVGFGIGFGGRKDLRRIKLSVVSIARNESRACEICYLGGGPETRGAILS